MVKTTTKQYIKDALKITELYIMLQALAEGDGLSINDIELKEVIQEAKNTLDMFQGSDNALSDMLTSFNEDERKVARKQIQQLKKFISKYNN